MVTASTFAALPSWLLLGAFGLGALAVWRAGTVLSRSVDGLAERYGLHQAWAGMVLLGIATSLPEIAAVSTAGFLGNAPLAVNNLLGGIAFQTAVLVIADARLRGGALTSQVPRPDVLLQGVLLMMGLGLVAMAVLMGGTWALLGVGAWSVLIMGFYVFAVLLIQEGSPKWHPIGADACAGERLPAEVERAWSRFTAASLVVLVAGYAVTVSVDSLAPRVNLGAGFASATFLAAATSLPEISSTLTAVRIGAPALAVGNIFGTNLVDAGLILVADVTYRAGPVLSDVGGSAIGAALVGLLLTGIYVVGLLLRSPQRVLGVGLDSLVVVIAYVVGLWALFALG